MLNRQNGRVTVELYEDEEDSPYKTCQLIPDTSSSKAREWISVSVDQESEFHTILFKNESVIEQTIISAIRIYCSPGAFTGN